MPALSALHSKLAQHLRCAVLCCCCFHPQKPPTPTAARNAAYKPLADTISSRGAPLLDDAAAISQLAAKLRPMVSRAQQLQAEQQQEPMQQALAAADGVAAGDADAAAGSGGDVERRVRQVMAETAASAEQLQAAAAALEAA
jgi:hypothetical protein